MKGASAGPRVATSASELVARLRALGVRVWVEGGRVRVSAPKGVMTEALRSELAQHRDELLAVLSEERELGSAHRIERRTSGESVPLSFAQQRLWFLHQLDPDSTAYTIAAWFQLDGPIDVTALERAIADIVQRHEILRTTFTAVDGQPMQVVDAAPPGPALIVYDLSDRPVAERAQEADRLVREEARRPFSLAKGPLFRSRLLRLDPAQHRVLLVVHHMVFDGWSLGVLVKEISHLYQAYVKGETPSLPDLPIQYGDFAAWQQRSLKGGQLERHREYWLERLRGATGALRLPLDRQRSGRFESAGAGYPFELSPILSIAAKTLARQKGVTPFVMLLAGFVALLHRYAGDDDVVVGSPIANRTRVELEGLIGMFANTLVLRSDVSGDPTFSELLGRVRDTALGAFEHQDMPFEKLVEELHPERALGQNPLFQVAFAWQPAVSGLAPTFVTTGSAFDLSLFLAEGLDGVFRGAIEYRTDLFDADTIARLTEHFQVLLTAATADPDRRLSDLPLMTEAEHRRIIVDWNATSVDLPAVGGVHELVEQQARRTPDAVAAVFEAESMTYLALDRAASRLATQLHARGVQPGVVVGICVERSLGMLVALLGILKAGGAYVPLDPAYPAERLAFMVDDAGCKVLVTQTHLRDLIAPGSACLVFLDGVDDEPIADASPAGDRQVSPDDLAYVIYTSGSTGRPKGVQVPHRGVVNLLAAMAQSPGLTARDVLLAVTTLSFDIAALELFLPLTVGGRVVVASRESVLDPAKLMGLLQAHEVSVMQATPTTWRLLLDAGWRAPVNFKILCGGEMLSRELADRMLAPDVSVWNLYGPTETTIWSTIHKVEPESASVPIGRPIANTQLYVLDPRGRPVPVGVAGELHIGGRGVAAGYLNLPGVTAERFVPDRLHAVPVSRLYRTGDQVRYRRDGSLEFLGRLDHQVKVRGFRVEPGEIETALLRHADVREAVVVVRADRHADKQLVAYVVTERPLGGRELRDFLRLTLPDHMVPVAFVPLERLPLTANGKIDRRALPELDRTTVRTTERVEPTDELERLMVGIWEETLQVSPIGIRDDFFDLGGHSLLAVRVFARLQRRLGHNVPLAALFQAPTIEALAKLIRTGGWTPTGKSVVLIQPHGNRPPLFAAPGVGGNVLGFNDLARLLGANQPFYGLQSVGLNGEREPLTRIDEIAAHFLTEVRAIQPQGPYYLLGACMGGVVAYEMAQQLVADGQRVAMLALLETWHPTPGRGLLLLRSHRGALMRFVVGRLLLYLQTLRQLEPTERREYIRARLVTLREAIRGGDAFRGDRSELNRSRVARANLHAFQQYVPRPYPGSIVAFSAQGRHHGTAENGGLAWRELAVGGMDVYVVPGQDSGSIMVEPHVRVLVEGLAQYLDRRYSQEGARP